MSSQEGVTRRDFVAAASGAAAASLVPGAAGSASKRRRYAIVGTGVRGIGMWGRPLVERYSDVLEFVGLCDVNPLRVEVGEAGDRRRLPHLHQPRRRCSTRRSPSC